MSEYEEIFELPLPELCRMKKHDRVPISARTHNPWVEGQIP